METILVVEDDPELRHLFRTALTLAGYRVLETGDGLQALRLIDTTSPDAVVLDLGLPLVSGQAVLQDVAGRAHSQNASSRSCCWTQPSSSILERCVLAATPFVRNCWVPRSS